MSVCRKCACAPHHGPCGTWDYSVRMVLIVLVAMLLSSFLADFYIYIGAMKCEC